MNNKVLTAILILALFIPTFVAIGYYSSSKTGPNNKNDVQELTLKDTDGAEWHFAAGDGNADSDALIELFFDIPEDAMKVDALPEALMNGSFYLVTVKSFGAEQAYQYYFTPSPSEAYYVNGTTGDTFKILSADAEKFLKMTKYSASVFPDRALPTLLVGGEGGTVLSPSSSAEWYYTLFDGTQAAIDVSRFLASDSPVCEISGGFDISFSSSPDYVSLVITAGDETLFDGPLENMSKLPLGEVKDFKATVNAEWYKKDDRSFFGKASYTFDGRVVEPAAFYLGQPEINNGSFVVIGGKNVDDPSKITFASEPSINYTPTFYKEGEYVYALVPIRFELEDGTDRTFKFTLSYRGVTQEMTLNVKSYTYNASSLDITKAVEDLTYSETARGEAEAALLPLTKNEELDTHAFSGTFLEDIIGPGSSDVITAGFGRYMTVTASGTQFRHTGVDYYVAKGTEVKAMNAGKVVYSGFLTTTGYIVVVDHGWGLKSWYMHLSECSVDVGDTVNKGDVVGLAGESGFAPPMRIHTGLTVGDIPVCVYDFWNSEIKMPVME